jgi:hypothetical protein
MRVNDQWAVTDFISADHRLFRFSTSKGLIGYILDKLLSIMGVKNLRTGIYSTFLVYSGVDIKSVDSVQVSIITKNLAFSIGALLQ